MNTTFVSLSLNVGRVLSYVDSLDEGEKTEEEEEEQVSASECSNEGHLGKEERVLIPSH